MTKYLYIIFLLSVVILLVACGPYGDKKLKDSSQSRDQAASDEQQFFYGEIEGQEPSRKDSVEITVQNVRSEDRQVVEFETYDNLDIIDGDIIIRDLHEDSISILGNIALGQSWGTRRIPYTFSKNLTENIKENIRFAMQHWKEQAGFDFVVKSDQDPHYINFTLGSSPTIGSSSVGRQQQKKQNIYLGSATGTAVAIHEIGHALGLWHEQSRSDRDQFVEIIWENIKKKNQFNFKMKGTPSGNYDYNSRMHYPWNAFAKDRKKPTIKAKNGNRIENNGLLSPGDIAAINALYP